MIERGRQPLNKTEDKIQLLFLPFWPPQIPPLGIACLKGYLQPHGYTVKIGDANTVESLSGTDGKYFEILAEIVPPEKRGNFYNVGRDVLHNHLMALTRRKNEHTYRELVKQLIVKTFYIEAAEEDIQRLHTELETFFNNLEHYIQQRLEEDKPALLGLSVNRGNLAASLFVFQWVRRNRPEIRTVMGGPVFSQSLAPGAPDFETFIKETEPWIDTIIIGEGEQLFLELLEGNLDPEQRVYSVKEAGKGMLELAGAPLPDYSELQLEYYPDVAAYTSRSCPFQCSFCTETVYWGRYRKKGAEQVKEELETLYGKHGHRLYLMCDSLLNPVVTGLAEAFFNSSTTLYWDGYLRVDNHTTDREKTLLWRRGGFYRARLGIESGSPQVLAEMGKNITMTQIKETISALAAAGIKTTTYWVIGHPGESEADFQQTLDLVEEMNEDIYEAWCSPFNYYPSGQVDSDRWAGKGKLVYPAEMGEMLLARTWELQLEPTREEAYRRMNRFTAFCRELGIPNPFRMREINEADERWKRLHINAVPTLAEIKDGIVPIDEAKQVEQLLTIGDTPQEEGDFDF